MVEFEATKSFYDARRQNDSWPEVECVTHSRPLRNVWAAARLAVLFISDDTDFAYTESADALHWTVPMDIGTFGPIAAYPTAVGLGNDPPSRDRSTTCTSRTCRPMAAAGAGDAPTVKRLEGHAFRTLRVYLSYSFHAWPSHDSRGFQKLSFLPPASIWMTSKK